VKSCYIGLCHHPTEINAVHQAVKNVSRKRKYWLFSATFINRTSDFADDFFAKSLSNFDELLLRYLSRKELQWKELSSWLLEK
jgi:UDP-N-acetylmuramate--alanine ligase